MNKFVISKNIEILEYFKNSKEFLGCFSTSKLPEIPMKFPSSFMVNTKRHWVAIVFLQDICLYFDSFADKKYLKIEIINYLKKKYNDENIFINKKIIQDDSSLQCAEFCISFIKNVHSLESYKHFLNQFICTKNKNDEIVKTLI